MLVPRQVQRTSYSTLYSYQRQLFFLLSTIVTLIIALSPSGPSCMYSAFFCQIARDSQNTQNPLAARCERLNRRNKSVFALALSSAQMGAPVDDFILSFDLTWREKHTTAHTHTHTSLRLIDLVPH